MSHKAISYIHTLAYAGCYRNQTLPTKGPAQSQPLFIQGVKVCHCKPSGVYNVLELPICYVTGIKPYFYGLLAKVKSCL